MREAAAGDDMNLNLKCGRVVNSTKDKTASPADKKKRRREELRNVFATVGC
jgi:hypothetical protein